VLEASRGAWPLTRTKIELSMMFGAITGACDETGGGGNEPASASNAGHRSPFSGREGERTRSTRRTSAIAAVIVPTATAPRMIRSTSAPDPGQKRERGHQRRSLPSPGAAVPGTNSHPRSHRQPPCRSLRSYFPLVRKRASERKTGAHHLEPPTCGGSDDGSESSRLPGARRALTKAGQGQRKQREPDGKCQPDEGVHPSLVQRRKLSPVRPASPLARPCGPSLAARPLYPAVSGPSSRRCASTLPGRRFEEM
jgi:hypothetical protein